MGLQKFFGKTFERVYGRKGKSGKLEVPWSKMLNFRDFINITSIRAGIVPKMDHHIANQVLLLMLKYCYHC